MVRAWKDMLGVELPQPFPRMTWAEAMARYGSDKPDLRFGLEFSDLNDIVAAAAASRCSHVRPARLRQGPLHAGPSTPRAHGRAKIDKLTELVKKRESGGAKGLAWARVQADGAGTSRLGQVHRRGPAKADLGHDGRRRGLAAALHRRRLPHHPRGPQRDAPAPARRARAARPRKDKQWQFAVGHRLPALRAHRQGLRLLAPPLHLAARGRPPAARQRPGAGARASLRPRAQRQRDRRRLDPNPSLRRPGQGVRGARHRREEKPRPSSASCSRPSATARRRTAASLSASTASRCSWLGPPACAT